MKRFIQNKQMTILILMGVLLMTWPVTLPAQENVQQYSVSDTLFEKMSIDELIQIREYFNNKVDKLREEEQKSLSEGKRLGEGFLGEKGATIKDRDKIYVRIAEYYIEDAERSYEEAYERLEVKYSEFDRQMKLYNEGKRDTEPALPETPKYDYTEALNIYDKLLDEYPASDFADDALYNKAWLLERMDRGAESRRIYQEVIDKYPDSRFAPESYIRLAEYFFAPRDDKTDEEQVVVELRKAIQLYKKVLNYRDSKRYDEALYKLGWSYYKLAARDPKYYDDSIVYFMAVADDITRAEKLDPNNKISNPDVRDEAIEYIGISFTDETYTSSGVDKARRMIERIGGREYGVEIMRAIGRTFQRIDEQEKAIYAFNNLLDMYPMYEEAALIQQRVVEGLYALGRDSEAYEARERLYSYYNPKSEWYAQLEQSDIKNKIEYLDETYKHTEAALRTNILLDLEKAEEMASNGLPAVSQYEVFADHCQLYLDLFPADSNAYDINWSYAFMLDSRLGRFKEAFEEYITVSNDYLQTKHQHNAALNAVFMADTLVKIKYGVSDSVSFNLADIAQLSPEALTPEENRLIEAYDNYIRLFPDGEYTPNFLASAGGIYYNHKKFAEAKVYFQTLVKRFPGAEEKSLAMRSIMDSYFALGKFRDSEIIAKRILSDQNISEEQRDFAAKRLAQAIFKNAEFLEEQGDYFAAANEFFRIYAEAPTDPRMVQAALFNSGRNFENAKDWVRSIATYDTLVTAFPQSEYAVESLERIADCYKELEEFVMVGVTFERIFNEYREAEVAELSLYNSSFYYQKGEDWANAIRVNNVYISNFPDQAFSVDLFFKNAELFLKMDNILEANRIYEEFAVRYPDDPRTVEAFYRRGNYYFDNDQETLAKAEYNKAIARSEQFRREGKDPNPYIAGEAVNKLADILHREYVSIELTQPQSNIDTQLARLRSLLTELNSTYSKVLTFGSPRSFEATFNIARSYEEFASTYAEQEINPALSRDRQFLERKRINEESAALYDKAIEEYKRVIDNIPIIAEKLGVDMTAQPVEEDTMAFMEAEFDTTTALERAAEVDSTRDLAGKYHLKAKDKVSELLYTKATLTSENIYQAVNVESPSQDILTTIIFKVKLFQQAVNPAVESTINAHLTNIQEAEALGLSNKYVEESKRQVLLTSNILASEYEALTELAFEEYEYSRDQIKILIEREFEAVNEQGLDYYTLDQNAAQMIDYAKILSEQVLKIYENTLVLAEEHDIENDLIRNTKDRLLRYAVEVTDKMQVYADSATKMSEYYMARFDSTENYNYDDGRVFFENYYFNFNEDISSVLQIAYQARETYDIKNLWANKLLLKLIKMDPVAYSASIEKERVVVVSDESWKYSTTYFEEEWVKLDFNDTGWSNAEVVPSTYNPFFDLGYDPQAIWVRTTIAPSVTDTMMQDTLSMGMMDSSGVAAGDTLMSDPFAVTDTVMADSAQFVDPFASDSVAFESPAFASVEVDTQVYFRKSFDIDGTPVSGAFYVTADEDYRVFLNGEYMIDDMLDNYSIIDTLDYYTLEYSVKPGKNVIAVDVIDADSSAGGMKFYGFFEILPSDITAAAEKQARVEKIIVDPVVLKKLNVLNKNRISTREE